jgi:glycosyltransferase involved in cell wall biosynthesis
VKALLVAPTFGAYGGMEAFVFAVAEALLDDERFDVRICFKRAAGFALDDTLNQATKSFPVEFCERGSSQLWSAIRWADIVHGQNASPDVAAMACVLRKPLALTLHNALPAACTVRKLAWRLSARSAATRWYNSRFVWYSWERDRARKGSAHVPPVSRLPGAFVAPEDRRGFVFLGRLVPGKGADILLDAYERAHLDPREWPLTVVGEGPLRAALEERCRVHHLGVRFVGFLDGRAKAECVAGAKWLVVPSHWQEPFGLVALEARNMGVPCIATRDGGLPEAAGSDALMCVPGDVAELAALLRTAAVTPHELYLARATRTKRELENELVPSSFYPEAYLRLLNRDRDSFASCEADEANR